MALEGQIDLPQVHALAVPFYHQGHGVAPLAEEGAGLTQPGDLFSVHRQQNIPRLQAAVFRSVTLYRPKIGVRHRIIEEQQQNQSGNKVHEGPGTQDNELFPELGLTEGPRIVRILILPFHGTVTAHRKQAQTVFRLAPLPVQQGRPHPNGKLIYPDAKKLCSNKMSKLMHRNQRTENQDSNDDIKHRTSKGTN